MQFHFVTLPVQLEMHLLPMLFRVKIDQAIVTGFCDFIAQCTLAPQGRNEDIFCDKPPSDLNTIVEVQRVPVGSSSGT